MKNFLKQLVSRILIFEARNALKKYKPKIIVVTGSVGKTLAKEAIFTTISSQSTARRSLGSMHDYLDAPLTVLGLDRGRNTIFTWIKNIIEGALLIVFPYHYPQWLILEADADRPGSIKNIAEWIQPDIALVTRLGEVPAHIEFFPSLDDMLDEKHSLIKGVKPDGIFIFNHDDARLVQYTGAVGSKKFSFGFNFGADVQVSHTEITYGPYNNSELQFPNGVTSKINYQGSAFPSVVSGAIGNQQTYAALAAFSVAIAVGMKPLEIVETLKKYVPLPGRMRLLEGIKDFIIIDDTLNASPVGVHEALSTLEKITVPGKKVAVIGDMMELGSFSIDEHKRVGEIATRILENNSDVSTKPGMLVCVGIRARAIADAALDAGMDENNVLQFDTAREAGKFLAESVLQSGDIVLVKGSQLMRLEQCVEEIMKHGDEKEKLLVRQDKPWISKK